MSDENNTPLGGGEALPAAAPEPTKAAPRSDAEAAAQEAERATASTPEPAATPDAEKEKKNRTRDYIDRINRERADLARENAELKARNTQPQQRQAPAQPADGEPSLENYDFDVAKFQRAHSAWAVDQALKQRDESTQQAESTRKQQEIFTTYESRIVEFADDHPDFAEVVGSIAYPLPMELQAAIMAHDKGPQIAYHLGNNDDDAFALASIQPHLAAAAVERLASRLTAAPTSAPTPAATSIPAPAAAPKPISQAPAPTPTVSGRSPTETPPEKLTDDEWYARERERSRKR